MWKNLNLKKHTKDKGAINVKRLVTTVAVTAAVLAVTGVSVTASAETVNKKNDYQNSTNYTNRQITRLSAIYESNNNPGNISLGRGDFGGKSYGAWQFSSRTGTLKDFMNYLKREKYGFYFGLVRAEYTDKDKKIQYGKKFDEVWKTLAQKYPNEFYNLQMEFVRENYYDKLIRKLRREGGYAKVLNNLAVQNVLLSTAIQNGVVGAYNLVQPLKYVNNPREFIQGVYKQRAITDINGNLVNFTSSSKEIQKALKNRFSSEEKTALNML